VPVEIKARAAGRREAIPIMGMRSEPNRESARTDARSNRIHRSRRRAGPCHGEGIQSAGAEGIAVPWSRANSISKLVCWWFAQATARSALAALLALAGLCATGVPASAQDLPPPLTLPAAFGEIPEQDGSVGLFGDRLKLKFSDADSSAFQSPSGVLAPGFSEESDYWRREGGVAIDVLRSQFVTLSLDGAWFDARTPDMSGRGGLDIRPVTDWREQSFGNAGLDLGLFGDRIAYSTGLAHWRSDASSAAAAVSAETDSVAAGGEGRAEWHHLDAKLLQGGPIDLSAYGHYSLVDPSYQAPATSTGPPPLTTGETREFGGTIGFGSIAFSPSYSLVSQADSQTSKIAGSLDFGPVGFALSRSVITSHAEGDPDDWSSRNHLNSGTIDLDLEEYRDLGDGLDGAGFWRMLPSSVSLSGSLAQVETAGRRGDPEDLERGLELGFAWYWESAETTVDLGMTDYDSRAAGLESDDMRDWSLDISQGFYGDIWDFSGYLSIYRSESGDDWADLGLGGGLDFTYFAEDLPDVSLSVSYDWSKGFAPDDSYEMIDQPWSIGLSLDFAKFLPIFIDKDKPRLTMTYYAEGTSSYDSDEGTTKEWGQAFTISGGFKF